MKEEKNTRGAVTNTAPRVWFSMDDLIF